MTMRYWRRRCDRRAASGRCVFGHGRHLSFSPFFKPSQRSPPNLFHAVLLCAIILAEFLRQGLGAAFFGPHFLPESRAALAGLHSPHSFPFSCRSRSWNNTRNESKLQEQQRLLMQARLDALTNQINPHFLFNTLNSVSSLIRTNPHQGAHGSLPVIEHSSALIAEER